ncbi:ATP-grasp domain-containing protein [Bacillus thuringiensis]|uniref:ATP-grasp domain-containing protein n=1 Tax=Bacillus sp. ok061 TaxID=1761766 RepID=UPI00089EBD44|nr:ATP-grasp domain-containing protein [Bacillus sp. ok061]MED1902235.1 ATP-grasp domain-containing protein [Bacillus thuringiensis]SEG84427.1 Biotin carboxylase [Bacillus sp. ok061]
MKSVLVVNTGDRVHSTALAARPDLKVTFVIEERFIDMYPKGSDLIIVKNLNNPSESTQTVVESRNCNEYSAVISLSERAALTAAYIRSFLGLEGPSVYTVLNTTNKFAMKRKLETAGVTVAQYKIATTQEEAIELSKEVGFPVIIKPIMGAGSDATKIFYSVEDIKNEAGVKFFNQLKNPITTSEKEFPVIIEQFLDVQQELHCDALVIDGEVKFIKVSKYIKPVIEYNSGIFGSITLPNSNEISKEVIKIHEKAIEAVGINNGVTHLEVFVTSKGLIAGEIASRPGGGGIRKMLNYQNGFDSWEAHIALSLQEKYIYEQSTDWNINDEIGQFMLPVKRGKIKLMSIEEDFMDIPGYISSDIKVKSGDVIDGLLDSSAVSGIIYVKIPNSACLDELISLIEERFQLEIEERVYN